MSSRWNETIDAINNYVKELKGTKTRASVSVFAFDSNHSSYAGYDELDFKVLSESVPLSKWKKLSPHDVRPRGMTPLNDAILEAIERAEYGDHKRTSLIIMTDGIENASRSSKGEAKRALDRCRENKWDIVMLGADFDAMTIRQDYGISFDQTLNIRGKENLDISYSNLAAKTASYASTGESRAFTQKERDEAMGVYIAPATDPKMMAQIQEAKRKAAAAS